ncbi:polysaccharide deacetylase family protein [Arthrobacter sp. CDRTa11]|uniref:polysaccharide deacetylase family protein n=1 Tax=Arthrobacter sp. CDRTa11 TaxID=2651199 RepID=UPI0022658C4D|nr:polysaccharide deacetylase family protein [Arthrobacter sp. CDRTa11]
MEKPNKIHLPLGISLAVVASLVLTASVAVPVQLTRSPQVISALPGPAPEKVVVDAPAFVDMRVRGAGSVPIVARWQYINGAEAFNTRLDARLLGILDAHAGGRHEPSVQDSVAGVPIRDGESVTHEVVLATGSIAGSRFVQESMDGGVRTGYTVEITYEDLGTGAVTGSAALIDPEEISTLRRMLRDVPALSAPAGSEQEPAPRPAAERGNTSAADPATGTAPIPDGELLSAVTFTPAGEVSITLSRVPDTGSALTDPVTVVLSAVATSDVLSPAGQALRRQVIAGTPFERPGSSGVERINCDIVACAALTYDDGPNAQTARLLEILEKHNVKATFFQQGAYVNSHPQVARSVADGGHTIANHTMSHPYLTKLSPAGIAREVQGAQAAIEKAAGVVPAYLRPPYGATNASVASSVRLPQVLWDVDALDWQSRNKAVFIPRIMSLVKPGSIILQHDVHAATVDGQDELITQLKNRGYYLVTLPQLFAGIKLAPGGSYKCRGATPGCVSGRPNLPPASAQHR